MIWLETRTQADADRRRTAMWGTVFSETPEGGLVGHVNGEGLYEGGRFWADAIKDTRDDPVQRLAMAKCNLPLPAAFREAAIALRAMIRTKRKAAQPFGTELRELHRLAAIASLAPYDPLDITPFAEIDKLDLSAETIGWDKLPLLGIMDCKLMAETWPAPARHTTAERLYPEIRKRGVAELARHRDTSMAQMLARLDRVPSSPAASTPKAARIRRGLWDWLFG